MNVRDILQTLDYGPSPEAADEVRAWLSAKGEGVGHFIDGAFTPFRAEDAIFSANPATGEALLSVSKGGPEDVDAAVTAARAAQPGWAALTPAARARHLYALARHIQKRERFLSVLETLDNGKPIRESRDIDIPLAARHFYYHAGWAAALEAEFPDQMPHGVCAQVIPWNFPLLMLAWKVAPALAAGNTVVLKPAEQTPLSAIAFAEICMEVGLPRGVVNILQGDGATGAALVAHPDVDKVAFTGSTEVGRAIRTSLAGSGKALTLELGGKSPFVIFADSDLEAAVEGVVDGIWFNQGEVCCAGSRLLVQEGIAERFQQRLTQRLGTLRVGNPLDKSTDIGAIVSAEQLVRIRDLTAHGEAEGGTLVTAPGVLPEAGFFCAPGFFTGLSPAAHVAQVEIFGPIATLMTFRTPDEAIELANNTAYGLAASIWSQNLDVALDAAARIRAGVVWINGTNMLDAAAPFGGMRESGFGREGGRVGMTAYLRPRAEAPAEAPSRKVDFSAAPSGPAAGGNAAPTLDRTLKLFIGGKQVRADGGASYALHGEDGAAYGQAALGNRKDIRNAVEAARKANGWTALSGHARAQVLWFLAENMAQRREQLAHGLRLGGADAPDAEVDATLDRLGLLAGLADKLAGNVQSTRARHVTLAMNEAWGVMGITCPDAQPLLSMATLIGAALAMGNRVVAIPAPAQAWVAGDLGQLMDSSDVPGGAVNIVSGDPAELAPVLAAHGEVDAFWHAGDVALTARIETAAAGNLKPVRRLSAQWDKMPSRAVRALMEEATQVKTIWVPYGA